MGNIKLSNTQIDKEPNAKCGGINGCGYSVGASFESDIINNIRKKSTAKITHSTYLTALGIEIARLFIFVSAIKFFPSIHKIY